MDEHGLGRPPEPQPHTGVSEAAGVESVARLIADRKAGLRRGAVVWLWNGLAVFFGVFCLWDLFAWMAPLGWPLIGFILSWLTASSLNRMTVHLDHARAAVAFHELDRSVVGALMEALEWPNRHVQGIARLRLVDLLPTLTEADAHLLSAEQKTCLYDTLSPADAVRHPDFVLAVLRAMPAIGEDAAVGPVQRLATMRGWTRSLRRVREAARACLPKLERRVFERRTGVSVAAPAEVRPAPAPIEPRAPIPPHVEEVLQRVEAEMGNPPQLRLPFLIAAWGFIVPASVLLTCMILSDYAWYLAIPVVLVGVWASQLHRLTLTSRHKRIAAELAELDDVNAVGRLAEATAWPEPTLRAGALSALTRLLPRLRASDAVILSPYQRSCLYRALGRDMAWSHPDFVVALLKALEQVGDRDAVGPVRHLAQGTFNTARQRRVREAARECLPYLMMVADRNQQSQTLLRAACAPGNEADVLLRPAVGAGSYDPEWLLRAAPAPEEDEAKAVDG